MSDSEDYHIRRRLLEERSRGTDDTVGQHSRFDLLGDAMKYAPQFARTGEVDSEEHNNRTHDKTIVKPIVGVPVSGTYGTSSLTLAGDGSTSPYTADLYLNPADHTVSAGASANGYWQLNLNMFFDFSIINDGLFFGVFTAGTVHTTIRLDVIDATGVVLTSAEVAITYTTSAGAPVYLNSVDYITEGTDTFADWNGIRITQTNDDTAHCPSGSVTLYYATPETQVIA